MAHAQIEGGEELLGKLKRMGVDVSNVLEEAAVAGAQVIVDAANPLAPEPVITEEVVESGSDGVTVDVGLPEEKWHLRFFETGTSPHYIPGPLTIKFEGDEEVSVVPGAQHPGMAAQPFLRPAFDAKASGDQSAASQAVGEVVRRAAESNAE
jgi:HK97 gp10 family phage protein